MRNRKTLAIASTIVAAFILLFATVVLPSVPTASAAPGINRQVNFQGKVVNANGTNVPDASYSFRFRIYSSTAPTDATNPCSANSCLWEETKNITTVNGIFQTNLGDTTAFTGAVDFTDDTLHLAVRFNADTEMSPRIRLTAVPYAFNAERLGGLAASSFAQLSPSSQQTGTLNVSGDINSATSISVGGTAVCTASGCQAAGGSGSYIQNGTGVQSGANFNISGTGIAAVLQTSTLDTSAAGTLSIGTTNATSIALNKNVTVAAGQSISLVGGITATRPASPTEGMLYYDTTTKQLLVYANAKWQADRSTSTVIVGTSAVGGTSTAVASKAPEGADFVNTSTTSAQTIINSATASLPATGGSVYLMEGTYIVDGTIALPNNTTLMGAGAGTVIKLKNAHNANLNLIANSDISTGAGVSVQNILIDGNRSNQTAGTQHGIVLSEMGSETVRPGAKISNITIQNMRGGGMNVYGTNQSVIFGNNFKSNLVTGLYMDTSSNNMVSNNTIIDNNAEGISLGAGANNNVITGNKIHSSGNTGINDGIKISASDANTITSNDITDTSCTTTCFAINISNSTSDNNYLADNRHSATGNTSTINDAGTGTIYANQLDGSGNLRNTTSGSLVTRLQSGSTNDLFQAQDSSGNALFRVGNTGTLTLGRSNGASGTTGTMVIANSANNNTVTISSGTTTSSYQLNLPAAIGTAGQCLTLASLVGSTGSLGFGTCGGGGAATSLNNLASVAINTSLLPGVTNSINVGSAALTFANGFYGTSLQAPLVQTADGTGASTALTVRSGNATTSGATGALTLTTGSATSGNSGSITINVGTASATRGSINIGTVGTAALTSTINIANTTGNAAQTVGIGSTSSTSTTTIQGGVNGTNGTVVLQTAASGYINIGVNAVNGKVVQIGSVGATANTSTVNIATSTGAAQTVSVGSTNGASTTTISAGTGNLNLNINQTTASVIVRSVTNNSATAFQVQNAAGTALLSINTSTAAVTINADTTIAAGKSLTLTGSGTRPASPTPGMLYYDTTTNTMLQYNGSKWVSDRTTSTKIVAASDSSQAVRDSADYVAPATGAQATINIALSAAAGGSVYLAEGTYNLSAAISIPDNTTLFGAGSGTLITIPNAQNGSYDMIQNTNQTTGTGAAIRDLRIDGNRAGQTSGSMSGIKFTNMGGGSGISALAGAKVTNVVVRNVYGGYSIYLASSDNNTLTGNTIQGNDYGIYVENSDNNTLTGNTSQGNTFNGFMIVSSNNNTITGNTSQGVVGYGFGLENSDNNTLTGNTSQGNTSFGIILENSDNNTLTGNTSQGNTFAGISLNISNNNAVGGNKIHANNGTTANNGIYVEDADANTITGNDITDTSCTTTCFAIYIFDSESDNNYLADNRHSATGNTSTISDAGTGTIYANQLDGSGNLRNSSSGSLVTRLQSGSTTDLFQAQDSSGNSLFRVASSGVVSLGRSNGASGVTGTLVVANANNNNTITISSGTTAASYNLVLPTAVGAAGECLMNSATPGVLTWGSCGGGGGGATRTIKLVPEYAGGTFQADGSNNAGTMTADSVKGLSAGQGYKHSYYQWTTANVSAQDYDIVVNTPLPGDYASGMGALKIWTYSSHLTNATATIQLEDVDGTLCYASPVSITPGSTNTWTQITVGSITGCAFAASDIVTVTVRIVASNNAVIRIGEFEYQYTN